MLRKLRQRGARLAFYESDISAVDEAIVVQVFPEIGTVHGLAGLRLCLPDISRIHETIGVCIADERGH